MMRNLYQYGLLFLGSVALTAPAAAQTQISTCADLQAMQNDLDGDYVLAGDVDCAGFGTGFEPVGTNAARFTGTLDGQGYTIRNLTIQKSGTSAVGLFGSADGAVIENVTLENVDITGLGAVGGLFGVLRNGLVSDVEVDGAVTGRNAIGLLGGVAISSDVSHAATSGTITGNHSGSTRWISYGGLLGAINIGSHIHRSQSSASVLGNYKIGGLVGSNQGTITESFATGDVDGWYRVGGFVGENIKGGTISNSYAMGNVSGSHEVAGFAGLQEGSGTLIEDCYSIGTATGGANTRGFVGLNRYSAVVVTSFWDTQTSGHTNGGASGATGLPTADMQTESTFTSAGWDFTDIWVMVDYPRFQWEQSNEPPVADAGPDQQVECAGHAGTEVTLDGTGSSDPDGDPLTFAWAAPGITFDDPSSATPAATFPLGTTTVTLTVADPSGESSTDQVDITVVDTTPPTVSVMATPASLWPPNHQYELITLTVSVSDICDTAPLISATAVSDEADNGKGDGNTTCDIEVTTAGGATVCSSNSTPQIAFDPVNDRLELRAERSGQGDGRVYTITVTAEDASGHTASSTATVTVPHSQGSGKVVATAPEFGTVSYPNPANPSTTIRYALSQSRPVTLKVYNMMGQEIRTLVDAFRGAGRYAVEWDGRDERGMAVSSGIYLYRLEAGSFSAVRKITLVR